MTIDRPSGRRRLEWIDHLSPFGRLAHEKAQGYRAMIPIVKTEPSPTHFTDEAGEATQHVTRTSKQAK